MGTLGKGTWRDRRLRCIAPGWYRASLCWFGAGIKRAAVGPDVGERADKAAAIVHGTRRKLTDAPPSPSAPPASGEAKTVLVVDDEARFTETLAAGLEANGYRTLQAPNAAAGWDLAHAHLPALILCDIDMPGKDGLRLLQDIRDDAALADTPFVLMTGKPKYGNQRAAMDLLADDFLLKPFSLAALLSCVDARLRRAALSRRRSGGAAAPPSPPEKIAPGPPAPAPAGPAAAVPGPAGESPDSRAVLVIDDEDLQPASVWSATNWLELQSAADRAAVAGLTNGYLR